MSYVLYPMRVNLSCIQDTVYTRFMQPWQEPGKRFNSSNLGALLYSRLNTEQCSHYPVHNTCHIQFVNTICTHNFSTQVFNLSFQNKNVHTIFSSYVLTNFSANFSIQLFKTFFHTILKQFSTQHFYTIFLRNFSHKFSKTTT